jgi:rubredoxin
MTDTSSRDKLIADITSGKFKHIDGIFSPLTKQLIQEHGAADADMTQFWIMTPQDWCCPVCKRSKGDIVRKDKNNLLICRLVEHHDHMNDILVKRFTAISATLKGGVVADDAAERFAKRSSAMVSAYNNIVICQDCNNADANAKKAVGAPVDFSYSPAEISQFILPKKNSSHDIDDYKAREIWFAAKPTFELRMKIVERIANIAATNTHWFQETALKDQPERIKSECKFNLHFFYGLDDLPTHLFRNSNQSAKNYACWKTKGTIKAGPIPTTGECDHVTRVRDAYVWGMVPDDWICPVCSRSKRETIRHNKNKDWCFCISRNSYRDLNSPRKKKQQVICRDCGLVAEDIGREALKAVGVTSGSKSAWVELSDIGAVIKARPHTRHEILPDKADEIVAKVIEVITAEIEEIAVCAKDEE